MPPPQLATPRPPGPLARALIALTDPERPRALAERRVGQAVRVAVPLDLPTGRWGSRTAALLALTDTTVYLLTLRDLRPLTLSVGGVLAAFPRNKLVAQLTPQRVRRRVRVELSWPEQAVFVCGHTRSGPAVDALGGHLAADELGRLTP